MDGHDALLVCVAFIFGIDCCCGICGREAGMNREDIIRMAMEAWLDVYGLGKDRTKFTEALERFAELVTAQERDACATVC